MSTKTEIPPQSPASPGSAYYGAKVAFEIPKACEVEAREAWRDTEISDDLIDRLFALFPGEVTFESEDICSPHLLIVDVRELLTAELIESMTARINGVLQNDEALPPRT